MSIDLSLFKSGPPIYFISLIKAGVNAPTHLPIPVKIIMLEQEELSLILHANASLSAGLKLVL